MIRDFRRCKGVVIFYLRGGGDGGEKLKRLFGNCLIRTRSCSKILCSPLTRNENAMIPPSTNLTETLVRYFLGCGQVFKELVQCFVHYRKELYIFVFCFPTKEVIRTVYLYPSTYLPTHLL